MFEGYNRGLKIYNNTLTKIPFTGNFGGDGGWDFAVEMFYDQGTEFYGNTVIGGGFDTNWQLKGTYPYSLWIHDNTFTLPAVSSSNNTAITLEYSTDQAIVERNTIDQMSGCLLFTPRPGDTISNVTIQNNLCTRVGKNTGNGSNASFINIGSGDTNFSVVNLNIYNNTFLADPLNRPWWGIELGDTTLGVMNNINIKNNIMAHTWAGAIVQGGIPGVVMNLVNISNNNIYDILSGNDPVWTGTPPTNYTYANNIHQEPLFIFPSYQLQPGSAGINAGVNVGLPYQGSAPDIGYFESSVK
jgi:hypothetical protein